MNIINIDSRFEIAPWQIAFTESVLRFDRHCYKSSNSLYNLSQTIPFYLVDRYTFSFVRKGSYHIFNRLDDKENRSKFENEQENVKYDESRYPVTELLGFYVRSGVHGIPEIYLCTESIYNHTSNDEELTFLLAKVIIHELAHAFMDRHEYGDRDEFYEWMEESFANNITLNYFQDYDRQFNREFEYNYISHKQSNSAYKYVKEFILSQPNNYKLGYYLHENHIHDYVWWRNNKDEIKQKIKAKADWLMYVKSNINSGKFDRNILRELTHNVLLEDPYNEMPKDEK